MKNKEKILLLIIALQAAALLAFACVQLSEKPAAINAVSLPTADYALVVDDLDEDEKAAFCSTLN